MGESVFAPAQEVVDLWVETSKGTFSRFWETPAVGPSREKTEKLMKGLATFAGLYGAWINSSVALQAVFKEAMQRTQEKIAAGLVADLRPDSYKDFYKIWLDVYTDTFNEFLKSSDFAADLGEFTSKSMEYQRFMREMMEDNYLRPMNLPTKREMDEVNKEVYSLKKAVKEARQASREGELPLRTEIDQIKSELQALKGAIRDLTEQVKIEKASGKK